MPDAADLTRRGTLLRALTFLFRDFSVIIDDYNKIVI